tara:strand:+ start:10338 stop:10781 length:444 start_codon:yes stop_codon:yes gene_type:complete
MATISVGIEIAASPKQVWNVVKDISDHVNWMKDAERIDFLTEQRSGIGTMFNCATKVGPLRLKDKMEITEWVDEKSMGVSHEGLVTGTGRFSLVETKSNETRFTWEETLHFPYWMGGPLRNPVGTRLLALIWRKNLKLLKEQVEASL